MSPKDFNDELEENLRNFGSSDLITAGNANQDQNDGWFIGQFVDPDLRLRCRDDFEVKWGVHPLGEKRPEGWSLYRKSTTLSILIEGCFSLLFRGPQWHQQVTLEKQGDYVIFAPGVQHSWFSETDSVILTIRTPSIANDKVRCES